MESQAQTNKNYAATDFEPLRVEEIIAIYKRWYKLSVLVFLGVFSPAILVIFLILPLHEAKGTVWVNRLTPQSDFSVQQGAMAGTTTLRSLDRKEEIATYSEMVKARPIAEATIDKLSISMTKLNRIHDYRKYVQATIDGIIDGVSYAFSETKYFLGLSTRLSPEVIAQLNRVRLVDEFIKRIEVTPLQESNIIQISFKSSDPALAKEVVNVLLDEFLAFSRTIQDERARSFFSTSTQELRESLETAEGELLSLQKLYSSYSVDQQRQALVTHYAQAKNRLREIQIQTAKLESQIQAYQKHLQDSNPVLRQELKLRLVNTEVELTSLKTEFLVSEQMLERYVADLDAIGEVDLLIKNQQRKISQFDEAYHVNLRNLEGASSVQAMNLASLSAVRVVSYAAYPLKPIKPRRLYYLILAFGGSIIFGLGMPFMAYLNDTTIASTQDVKKYLGLDFVMVFPDLSHNLKRTN